MHSHQISDPNSTSLRETKIDKLQVNSVHYSINYTVYLIKCQVYVDLSNQKKKEKTRKRKGIQCGSHRSDLLHRRTVAAFERMGSNSNALRIGPKITQFCLRIR